MSKFGVILAGGGGTRLKPFSLACHKHLLPVAQHVMIDYPISVLISSGCKKICVFTHKEYLSQYCDYIRHSWTTAYDAGTFFFLEQPRSGPGGIPPGIAQGLKMAVDFYLREGNAIVLDEVVLCLGDNLFYNLDEIVHLLEKCKGNALVLTDKCKNYKEMGVLSTPHDIRDIETLDVFKVPPTCVILEKPILDLKDPLVVTGLYQYVIQDLLKPLSDMKVSERGEFEITDINNLLIHQEKMDALIYRSEWFDIGTASVYMETNYLLLSRILPQIV